MAKKSISRVRKSRVRKSRVRKSKTKTYKMDSRIPIPKNIKGEVAEFIDPVEIFTNSEIWGEEYVNKACVKFVRSKIYTVYHDNDEEDDNKDEDNKALYINTPIEISMFFRALKTLKTLPNFPKITDITIIGPIDDIGPLARYLETNTLLSLKLFYNNINDSQAIMLANALQTNTSLVIIDLSDNNIGDIGAVALAHSLGTNTSLRFLNLSYNKIGDTGAKAFKLCIHGDERNAPTNTTILNIFIHHNLISKSLTRTINAVGPDRIIKC